MVQTDIRELFVAGDAAERLDVLFGLLLDDVDDIVDGDDADQAILLIDDRNGNQVVAFE